MTIRQKSTGGRIRLALAAMLAVLVLGLSVMGSLPSLHHLLHSDDSSQPQECFVCLFMLGHVNTVDTAAAVVIVGLAGIWSVFFAEADFSSRIDCRLGHSRAPPFFVSSPVV